MCYIESITSKYHDEQEKSELAFNEGIEELKENLLACTDEDEAREMIFNFSDDFSLVVSALEGEDCYRCEDCGLYSEAHEECAN